jgi:hypothetical protein
MFRSCLGSIILFPGFLAFHRPEEPMKTAAFHSKSRLLPASAPFLSSTQRRFAAASSFTRELQAPSFINATAFVMPSLTVPAIPVEVARADTSKARFPHAIMEFGGTKKTGSFVWSESMHITNKSAELVGQMV